MSKKWYVINDVEDFTNSARQLVFKFFGETDTPKSTDTPESVLYAMSEEEIKEMDSSLPYNESLLIVQQFAKKQVNKKKEERYCITDEILQSIIEALNSRMVSNILHHLVNTGILESGYDAELGDFIFWIKEENDNQNQKPETD